MSVLQQVYHHPNLTSKVCSMLHSFVISRDLWLSILTYTDVLGFSSFISIFSEKMKSNTLHSDLSQRQADGKLPCTQQASWVGSESASCKTAK